MRVGKRSIAIIGALSFLLGCATSPSYDGSESSGTRTRHLGNDVYDVVVLEKPTGFIMGYNVLLKLRERAMTKWDLRVKTLTREKGYASCETLHRSGTVNDGTKKFGLAEGRVSCVRSKRTARSNVRH